MQGPVERGRETPPSSLTQPSRELRLPELCLQSPELSTVPPQHPYLESYPAGSSDNACHLSFVSAV